MPKLAGAEEKAKAEMACELIYKLGATLNGNDPPKLYLGPLALLSLDTPSLTSPCYIVAVTPVTSSSKVRTVPRIPCCSVSLPVQKVASLGYSLNTNTWGVMASAWQT